MVAQPADDVHLGEQARPDQRLECWLVQSSIEIVPIWRIKSRLGVVQPGDDLFERSPSVETRDTWVTAAIPFGLPRLAIQFPPVGLQELEVAPAAAP